MSISKRIRFEVFKRDGFRCLYCGESPPTITLEVDHIDPRANGGSDSMDNLISSCFNCNRGKGKIPLTNIPASLQEKISVLEEKENQLRAYRKLQNKIEVRRQADIDSVEDIYKKYWRWILPEEFKNLSIRRFLDKLPLDVVQDAMRKAVYHCKTPKQSEQYFCGICWNKIRGDNE